MIIEDINNPKIALTDLIEVVPNRFLLSVAAAKRARQLAEGAKPLVEYDPDRPFDSIAIALKEIREGHVKVDTREDIDQEDELIEQLDKTLDEELSKEEDKDDKKSKDKDSKKPKSKSLATS